jgi:hypothetical protein
MRPTTAAEGVDRSVRLSSCFSSAWRQDREHDRRPLGPFVYPDFTQEVYKFVAEGTPSDQPYNVAQAHACAADVLRGRGSFDVDFRPCRAAPQAHRRDRAVYSAGPVGERELSRPTRRKMIWPGLLIPGVHGVR